MRLSAWTTRVTSGGPIKVTVTFNSSSAARSLVLIPVRGTTASPVDRNPPVATDNTSPYNSNSTAALSQPVQLVIGYGVLNGPTVLNTNNGAHENDAIAVTFPDLRAVSQSNFIQAGLGVTGTTGGAASSNVSIVTSFRAVSATEPVSTQFTNTTANRNGLVGVVTFKGAGGTTLTFDLDAKQLIARAREYHDDQAGGTVTAGLRANRPAATPNGRGYWSTDQGGNWHTLNGTANDGCLDVVVGAVWQNCKYKPYTYPHPLADATEAPK
jgi:hypothetical protein